jgi:hypothetical protein
MLELSKHYNFAFIPQPLIIWHWRDEPTISKDEYRSNKGYQQIFEKHEKEILEKAGLDAVMNHLKRIYTIYQNFGASAEAKEIETKMNRNSDQQHIEHITWNEQHIATIIRANFLHNETTFVNTYHYY